MICESFLGDFCTCWHSNVDQLKFMEKFHKFSYFLLIIEKFQHIRYLKNFDRFKIQNYLNLDGLFKNR